MAKSSAAASAKTITMLLAAHQGAKLAPDPHSNGISISAIRFRTAAGFGLGVERTVAWICGLDHVRETIPFPG